MEAGPLPALFLRSTAANLERGPIPLGLYLGSDHPIADANLLTGVQAEQFAEIRRDGSPRFFYDADSQRFIAMFPDVAADPACVNCHNDHESSPKHDWKLNDIMGATTWSFPRDSLTTRELLAWIDAYNWSAQSAYASYLEKTRTFNEAPKPEIGNRWPSEGRFLPDVPTFSDAVLRDASFELMLGMLDAGVER